MRLTKKQKAARRRKTLPLVPLNKALNGNRAQILGYARVSTRDQVLDMQITALKKSGCHRIFAEKISAKDMRRPQLRVLLKFAEPGDTIVVYSYSRLSRDLRQLLTLVDELKARNIKLVSTTEAHIDPYTTNGRLLLSVTGAVDETERRKLGERTRDGMREKMAQGQSMGRPRVVDESLAVRIKREFKSNSAARLSEKYGISKSAVYNAVNS